MALESRRILIVDNNELESRVIASLLEEVGYEPTVTWSGLQALELVKSGEYLVLVVGNYLPDLYVGDFLARLNCLPTRPYSIVMRENPCDVSKLVKLKAMIKRKDLSKP